MKLATFDDPASMERASKRFVALLGGKKYAVENVLSARLPCGHERKYSYRYGDTTLCRQCRSNKADLARERRLPDMLSAARAKVRALETEAARRGLSL